MRVLFAGTSDIGEHVLDSLATEHELVGILSQPDRPAGRKKELTPPAIKKIAQEFFPATPLFQPEKLRDAEILSSLQALKPEVIVTMAYGKILPLELLSLPSIACLNIHVSLLPRHRGASPIQAAILSGDEETGITIMYMAEGLDTGDILLQKKLRLHEKETAGSLSKRLADQSPKALREALQLLQKGNPPRSPQEEKIATITHRILRADAFLDWSRSATELERLVRAMNPKPGAHGSLQLSSTEKIALKIFSASLVDEKILCDYTATVGQLFFDKHQQLLVRCGEGALQLEEVQPEGRARMSAAAFARGQHCLTMS